MAKTVKSVKAADWRKPFLSCGGEVFYNKPEGLVICGDGREILPKFPKGSIDLILTSPPPLGDSPLCAELIKNFSHVCTYVPGEPGVRLGGTQSPPSQLGQSSVEIINCLTEPDQLVCDPFSQRGSTVVIAKELYRRFIAIEINPKFCASIVSRLKASKRIYEAL